SSVRVGSIVNVVVSKGGASALRVPNFVNMTIDEARQAAEDAHLHLGQVVWTPFGRYGPPRGDVVRQSPGFNALIDPAESVSLQISAGPLEAGYLIRQVHATVTVPEDSGDADHTPVVRVEVVDETGTWNVYNAYAQPKQKLDFNLTVVGTAELNVYINNEPIDSTRLGVEPKVEEKQILGPLPSGSHRASSTPSARSSGSSAPPITNVNP
ncbi:MAG TPA: PASTA domain-containing protein, partial [Xanthobacteraceae bacterium]|nr:PASTA domain-containing protein [Xanthobacteraceae bacterium]